MNLPRCLGSLAQKIENHSYLTFKFDSVILKLKMSYKGTET